MYSEQHKVLCPVGLHGETLNAFATHFPPGIAFINNIDVTDKRGFQELYSLKDVEIAANTGDPETDKNVVDIIKAISNFGHDPWRGKGVLPAQFYAQAAEFFRNDPKYGLQGGMQTQPSAPVSGEMTTRTLARWNVVALGELQQPSGVGATQQQEDTNNPLLEGPNLDGPNFEDNSQNSQEQEIALQTWVNHAVNMLNQGDDPEVVVAKLAHDGCPEPESVLKMALEQPEKSVMDDQPVTDEIGQDPFQAPVADDSQGSMESVFRQPPVQAKVRIAGSTLTGVEIDRWEDVWGQGTVKIALDDGGTMNVATEAVEEYTENSPEHPVSQIQQFIDSLPRVEPSRPHIQARIDNLELVRRAVRSTISKVGFSDQVKLMGFDTDAQTEIEALKNSLGATISESDVAYLSGQQTYRPHGVNLPGVESTVVVDPDFQKKIAEKAAIFVAELPSEMISDADSVAYAAARYASEHNANVAEFVKLAEDQRFEQLERLQPPSGNEELAPDNEGPAEGLYF